MFNRVYSVTNETYKTYGYTSRIAATANTHTFVVGHTNTDNSPHPTPTLSDVLSFMILIIVEQRRLFNCILLLNHQNQM
jgi:hypothetical protein